VSDVAASSAWYVRELGFEEVLRQRQDNDYTRQLVGVDGAILDVAVLELLDDAGTGCVCRLELIEYVEPTTRGDALQPGDVGFSHLSFEVDDIHAEYLRLRNAARFRSPPVAITAGRNAGGFVCYFTDPDGNGLELFESPKRNDPKR
jgi:catechol 2,3-dioxygenase-like lactoylglutathione lyase family enzyme